MRRGFAKLHQPVEALAVDQRFQPRADLDIGRRLARFGIADHPDRMLRTRHRQLAQIGGEAQPLLVPRDIDRDEGRVVDGDADLFDRGDEVMPVALALEDRGKKLDHPLATDRRALVEPRAVARDPHVEITAERRIPQMHRCGAPRTRPACRRCEAFRRRSGRCLTVLCVCHRDPPRYLLRLQC